MIPVMILGESGSGKTSSLRNLDPNRVLLLQTISKRLPFRAKGWEKLTGEGGSIVCTDNWERLIAGIKSADTLKQKRDIIVIDDFQYMLANEFMRRSSEKGFEKFTQLAEHAWQVVMQAQETAGDARVYFLWHTQTDEFGATKAKTIGKLLDEKITMEGLFTIVLRSMKKDGQHVFMTQSNGQDTVKTPMEMFSDLQIENDLQSVDDAICEYYNIPTITKEEAA